MERLTFEGNFCDIAQCRDSACRKDGTCTQKEVWKRLKAYEDTGLTPEDIKSAVTASAVINLAAQALGAAPGRLRELAEADKDGRVVVLPCKVGDMLYEVTSRSTISEYRVTAICATSGGLFIEWKIQKGFAGRSAAGIVPDAIGKTVFLTREEAEKELEGTKNG